MQKTDWEIADEIKEKHGQAVADEWLELFDYNYSPIDEPFKSGWPWYGKGEQTIVAEANDFLGKFGYPKVIGASSHESGEQYVWVFEGLDNIEDVYPDTKTYV